MTQGRQARACTARGRKVRENKNRYCFRQATHKTDAIGGCMGRALARSAGHAGGGSEKLLTYLRAMRFACCAALRYREALTGTMGEGA